MRLGIVILAAFILTLCGCVASSNFYSGRTLEEGTYSVGFSADDIALKSSDKSIEVNKGRPFAPSFNGAVGLPWRLEFGMRYYPVNFVELVLREQINPRSFEILDASANCHFGMLLGGYSYLKYGVTVSKEIHGFEPYVHIAAYRFAGSTGSIFDNSFVSGVASVFINENREVGLGLALPLKQGKLYPEVNYQYFGGDLSHGLWHFGIGIRVFPGSEPRNE
jgi:hypothetical protein